MKSNTVIVSQNSLCGVSSFSQHNHRTMFTHMPLFEQTHCNAWSETRSREREGAEKESKRLRYRTLRKIFMMSNYRNFLFFFLVPKMRKLFFFFLCLVRSLSSARFFSNVAVGSKCVCVCAAAKNHTLSPALIIQRDF